MAFGCIPIVSNLPANIEWIENNTNGLIVVPKEVPEALNTAISMNIDEVSSRNKDIIQQKATKEVNKKIFTSIYDKLLNR